MMRQVKEMRILCVFLLDFHMHVLLVLTMHLGMRLRIFLFSLLIGQRFTVSASASAFSTQVSAPNPNVTAITANIVTEEWVQSIINSKGGDLELVDFSISPGSEIGDNLLSEMYSVKIRAKSKTTGELSTTNVMFKMLQQDPYTKTNSQNLRAFEKEAKMYTQVLPDFVKFQQGRGLKEQEIFKAFPKCYKTHVNNTDTDYIVIEDLRPLGFKMANQSNGFDFIHCEIALRTLARFHAVSFALFGGDYKKIQEHYPFLQATRYLKPEDMDTHSKRKMSHVFKLEAEELRQGGFEAEANLIDSVYDDRFYKRMHNFTGEWVPNAVVGHGDFRMNNIMFAFDRIRGKPKEARLVDFQAGQISSRALDLNYFMYTSVQIPVLNEQEVQLLRIYHDEFESFCSKLGYTNEQLTFQALVDEFQSFRPYGISVGLLTAWMQLANKMDLVNLFAHPYGTEQNQIDTDLTRKYSTFNSMFKNPRVVARLLNIASNHIPKCPNEWTKTKTTAKVSPNGSIFGKD